MQLTNDEILLMLGRYNVNLEGLTKENKHLNEENEKLRKENDKLKDEINKMKAKYDDLIKKGIGNA